MRDRIYLISFLLGAGILLYMGRSLYERSVLVTWGLTFSGTTAAAVLGMALYRVQHELRASRLELATKEAELNFAREVQQALFPREFPTDRGLEFSAICVPARGISGDYYDVLRLPNGRVAVAIADITGKGISAAILMSNLHAVLRILASSGQPPGQVCLQLNQHLRQVTDSRFATVFYGEWNPAERSLSYFNAGHPAPLVLRSGGTQRLEAGGPPLGLFAEIPYDVGEASLDPGDLMALYSDGITEARTPQDEEFGEERLRSLLVAAAQKPLAEIQRQVLAAVRNWSGSDPEDDVTLLLIRPTSALKEAP